MKAFLVVGDDPRPIIANIVNEHSDAVTMNLDPFVNDSDFDYSCTSLVDIMAFQDALGRAIPSDVICEYYEVIYRKFIGIVDGLSGTLVINVNRVYYPTAIAKYVISNIPTTTLLCYPPSLPLDERSVESFVVFGLSSFFLSKHEFQIVLPGEIELHNTLDCFTRIVKVRVRYCYG